MGKLDKIDAFEKAKITLSDGTVLTGTSWDVAEAEDDDGESLGYEYLVFKADGIENPLVLSEEDIQEFEEIA